MIDFRGFALSMIRNNPNIANNPNAMEMVRVIEQNDSVKGEQLARNLCNTYGVTPQQGIDQARNFFNLR